MDELPRLATCSYTAYRRDMGTAVRTSLGAPRWITLPDPRYSRYSKWPYLAELAPRREYLKAPREEFTERYLGQLDRLAGDIERKLGWIEPEHKTICFLCFEDLSKAWCHRRIAAEWFERRYQIVVPELSGRR